MTPPKYLRRVVEMRPCATVDDAEKRALRLKHYIEETLGGEVRDVYVARAQRMALLNITLDDAGVERLRERREVWRISDGTTKGPRSQDR